MTQIAKGPITKDVKIAVVTDGIICIVEIMNESGNVSPISSFRTLWVISQVWFLNVFVVVAL